MTSFPTWLLMRLGRPFLPQSHPFRQSISLREWRRGQTALCRQFDVSFWWITGCVTLVALMYL